MTKSRLIAAAVVIALGVGVAVWREPLQNYFTHATTGAETGHDADDHHSHGERSKGLVLTDAARSSLGLELGPVVLQDYWRSVPIPAEVMEEPGHCEQGVSSTVHGIVLKIHAFHGQTVRGGDPLFDIRPTSELLATTQTGLLKSEQDIELAQADLKRIGPATEAGAIAATRRIEKEYELKRLETQRLLQMQELLVRGLSSDQIADIVRTKTLVREMTIRVPFGPSPEKNTTPKDPIADHGELDSAAHAVISAAEQHEHGSVYSIEQMSVHLGKLIQPGEELCRLARHSQLLIAGRAFERESFLVTRAIERNWPVKAIFEVTDESPVIREGLSILYADNVVESDSRTLRFYIPLANELVRDQPVSNGLAYRSWRFKPGQRARVLLPVEFESQQIVLPSEAVVKEGVEAFVFRMNGKRLERIAVRLRHLDPRDAVIKNDGILQPGDIVARNQAYQLDLAMKNSQEGIADSHEGHDHAGHSH